MRSTTAAALTAAAVLLAGGRASAQTVPLAYPAKIFVTVDAVQLLESKVVVTGIVQGDAAPSTYAVIGYSGASGNSYAFALTCQQQALLAMAKPGQYLLEIFFGNGFASSCKLTRVNP
jgi:hypothetical protein